MLLKAENLNKNYGGDPVFSGVNFEVNPRDRIGLVGANGAGKSTLVRMIAGLDRDYSGNITRFPGVTMGWVDQHFPDYAGNGLDFLLQDYADLAGQLGQAEETLSRLEGADLDKALEAYGRLRDQWDQREGDSAPDRALTLLEQLGLKNLADRSVLQASGGEKNRLALGRVLVTRPDLLILDEPGNHLDLEGLAWLEEFLKDYPAALILVSHNRYQLDRLCTRIFDLEGGVLTAYTGNYSQYRAQKLKLAAARGRQHAADGKKLERLEALVKKFREIASRTADPSWGRRLHSRVTQLEKTRERATPPPPKDSAKLDYRLTEARTQGRTAIQVLDYQKSYGEKELFRGACFEVLKGEKIGLVGPNGCGKSTLVRDLVNLGAWDHPVLRISPSSRVAYAAQHQEIFDPVKTVLDTFLELKPWRREEAYSLLSRYLFSWDDMEKTTGSLSGGERNRLQIARAAALEADLLILDEPTNHLDIPSVEALEEALEEFGGTVLAVSHDRYFLDRCTARILEVRDLQVHSWEGGFTEFWAARKNLKVSDQISPSGELRKKSHGGPSLEARIENLEKEKAELERQMAAASGSGNYSKAARLGDRLEKLNRELARLWEDFMEA